MGAAARDEGKFCEIVQPAVLDRGAWAQFGGADAWCLFRGGPMRFTYDRDADVAYLYIAGEIAPGGVAKTYGCDPGDAGGMINLDFDAGGRLVGIEVLDASVLLPVELIETATTGDDISDG